MPIILHVTLYTNLFPRCIPSKYAFYIISAYALQQNKIYVFFKFDSSFEILIELHQQYDIKNKKIKFTIKFDLRAKCYAHNMTFNEIKEQPQVKLLLYCNPIKIKCIVNKRKISALLHRLKSHI